MTSTPSLGDVVAIVHGRYDPATAEDWDAVGLVCGDPAAPVRRILVAVDAVEATVNEALIDVGVDLLLTHHPLLLHPVSSVAATTPAGRTVHRLVVGGCALLAAHTNADVAREGVNDALAAALGLTATAPPESCEIVRVFRVSGGPVPRSLWRRALRRYPAAWEERHGH